MKTVGVSYFPHAPAYEAFQALLATARKGQGVTQAALAAKLGCPQSLVSKIERGERRLDVPEFVSWAKALGVDVHAFIDVYLGALKRPSSSGRILSVATKKMVAKKR